MTLAIHPTAAIYLSNISEAYLFIIVLSRMFFKGVHALIPGNCQHVTFCDKEAFAGVIKMKDLKVERSSGIYKCAQSNTMRP